MTHNTDTQLKYINRDGRLDSSFVLAVKRAQASKYASQLLKTASTASLKLTWHVLARVSDDLNKSTKLMTEYESYWNQEQATTHDVPTGYVLERSRNVHGQFVAN